MKIRKGGRREIKDGRTLIELETREILIKMAIGFGIWAVLFAAVLLT